MRNLGDIPYTFKLYGVCARCRRMAPIGVQDLIRKFGPEYPVARIRDRVRCRQCGELTQDVRLVYAAMGDYKHS